MLTASRPTVPDIFSIADNYSHHLVIYMLFILVLGDRNILSVAYIYK